MPIPFFSILIPTRFRAHLLEEAIQSVLTQSFTDFELIVSINGPCLRSKSIATNYSKNNSRVKYLEYPNLPMHQHWERATRHLVGRYMIILTDRCLLMQHSLAHIKEVILGNDLPQVVTWPMQLYLDESKILLNYSLESRSRKSEIIEIDPINVFENELNGTVQSWSEKIPRGLNSAIQLSFLKELRKQHGTLFRAMSPDFTFATFCLLHTKSYIYINRPMYISRGLSISNGGNSTSGPPNKEYLNSLLPTERVLTNVPCKANLVRNSIFNDYITIALECNHNDCFKILDVKHYFSELLNEFALKVEAGRMIKTELTVISQAIVDSARQFSLEEYAERRVSRSMDRYRFYRLKYFTLTRLECLFPSLVSMMRRYIIILRGHGRHYPTALVAAAALSYDE